MNNGQTAVLFLMSGLLGSELAEAASIPERDCAVTAKKMGGSIGIHLDYHSELAITSDPVIELQASAHARCAAIADLTARHHGLGEHLDYKAEPVTIRPITGFISATFGDVH